MAMPQSIEEALFALLKDIFNIPCIQMAPSPSDLTLSNPENEIGMMKLLIHEARSATPIQLVELLLQLLLSHPPFIHISSEFFMKQQSRFLAIWKQGFDDSSAVESNSTIIDDERRLTPHRGLNLLVELRLSFQKLTEEGFEFVSELLLSCINQLSPESGGSSGNWVNIHKKSVDIISELLCSVPKVGWLRQRENARHITAIWKCLHLMTSGAAWWGKNDVFEKSLERLARRFSSIKVVLPTASSLLWGALRVTLEPAEIHSVLSLLLVPLERLHGFTNSEKINAYTPTPFSFPLLSVLDRHDFTNAYEFANLRVLFVAWLNADALHRELDEFQSPWGMETILQHTEAYKRLKLHPESAARIALGYIFNEVKLKRENFKPSTDFKAIELLQIYAVHRSTETRNSLSSPCVSSLLTGKPQSRPEACIIMNAEWVLPWVWQRRNTNLQFTMVMTSEWLLAVCGEDQTLRVGHPAVEVMMEHDVVLEVFNDFFRQIFVYDFISSRRNPEENLTQIRRFLAIILQAILLFSAKNSRRLNQQLYAQIIRCFVDSVDREWIPTSCWVLVCELFATIPRATLTEAFALAQVVKKMDLFIPGFLREIEIVASHCESHSVVSLPVELLAARLESLTAMLQFATFAVKADGEICTLFIKESHFIASMLKYIDHDYSSLLAVSFRPELALIYAASVGAACEVIIVTEFSTGMLSATSEDDDIGVPSVGGMTRQMKHEAAMRVVVKLIGNSFEMSYVIAPLCGLVAILGVDSWPTNQFTYLDIFCDIRMVLLQHRAHMWCCLFPVFIQAITGLLNVDAPIRRILIENRWNLELVVKMFVRIKNDDMRCGDCGVDFSESVLTLVALLIERRPAWCRDLIKGGGMGRYSMLTLEILEEIFVKLLTQSSGEDDRRGLAGFVIRIARAFPEWGNNAMVMERRLERANVGLGKQGLKYKKGFYRTYKPVEGVPFSLVPC